MRDRVDLHDEGPDSERDSDLPPYISLREVTPEHESSHPRLKALDGPLPSRPVPVRKKLTLPDPKVFGDLLAGSGKQEAATTMGFTRLLRNLARDPEFGQRVVPIVPDEARTFGMDSLFREIKIYASRGQLYEPVDHDLLLSYTEGKDGQILDRKSTRLHSSH